MKRITLIEWHFPPDDFKIFIIWGEAIAWDMYQPLCNTNSPVLCLCFFVGGPPLAASLCLSFILEKLIILQSMIWIKKHIVLINWRKEFFHCIKKGIEELMQCLEKNIQLFIVEYPMLKELMTGNRARWEDSRRVITVHNDKGYRPSVQSSIFRELWTIIHGEYSNIAHKEG